MKVAAMKKQTMKKNIMFIQKRKTKKKILWCIDGNYDDVDDDIDDYADDEEFSENDNDNNDNDEKHNKNKNNKKVIKIQKQKPKIQNKKGISKSIKV